MNNKLAMNEEILRGISALIWGNHFRKSQESNERAGWYIYYGENPFFIIKLREWHSGEPFDRYYPAQLIAEAETIIDAYVDHDTLPDLPELPANIRPH